MGSVRSRSRDSHEGGRYGGRCHESGRYRGRWGDIAAEAWGAIRGRRGRSALTLTGVAFGILTLVATIGLTSTAAAQVSARFNALQATGVSVQGFDDGAVVSRAALGRTARLNGVVAAGVVYSTQDTLPDVSRSAGRTGSTGADTQVMAADPGALKALRLRAVSGRLFDAVPERRRYRVALLGDVAARNAGVRDVDGRTLLFVAGKPYLLIGIVKTPDFDSQAPFSVILPSWTAHASATDLSFEAPKVMVRTRPGAAQQVGAEAKLALSPGRPGDLLAQVPPDPKQLRAHVENDTRGLFLTLAAVSLLIGAIGIGNTTLVAVLERRHEIGLRRAVGASRRSMLSQFLFESGLLGLLGGLVGTVCGLDLTISIALAKGWTAALSPWLLLAGPVLGLAVGLAAGFYPALKAARLEPVAALAS
ncbi:ABC transporter permease [Streptomyces sp. NPDC005562]|uniref:ABC transporter permease n=1 Tax=Streptomyces sp. NPDC005562 TaxID=3154890 RepID=UPI0033BD7DA4